MSRFADYRALQASVPGLENLYQAIGDTLAALSQSLGNVLIVGGGGGREIELLSERNIFADLTVVDPSPENLRQAKALAKQTGYPGTIEFVEGTVDSLSSDRKFHTAAIVFVLHTIDDAEMERRLLQRVQARLKQTGKLIVADMCIGDGSSVDDLIRTYTHHAQALGAREALINLETQAVLARCDRSGASLKEKLASAELSVTGQIGEAHWYTAVTAARTQQVTSVN